MDGFFANPWMGLVAIPFATLLLWELVKRRRPPWLILPRLLWISGCILLAMNWYFNLSTEWSRSGTIYVFVDESDSVVKVDSRREYLKQFLEEINTWAKEHSQPIQVFAFAEQLRSFAATDGARGGEASRLSSLEGISLDNESTVVVVSDGNWDRNIRLKTRSFVVGLDEAESKDVWIETPQPVMTAFLKNRLSIPIEVLQKGFDSQSVRVGLYLGQELLAEKKVGLESERVGVEMPYFPEKMGEQILSVRVEGLEGELSPLNNTSAIRVRTVRDKMRILHIGGKPSVDLKAWRLFLTRQPDVDLVSFYILRSLDDDPLAKNSELSLIPFPYDELFTTELEKFDVVILQNFNFNLYFQPFYLSNLARFVERGGAVLMIGGDQSFHRYVFSPLEGVMPFDFPPYMARFETGSYRASAAIQQHPILEGLAWAFEIPLWSRRHLISKNKNSDDIVKYKDGVPFVSLRQLGQGRILAINSDESWRLQMQEYGKFIPFNRFARRVLRYLTFDPEMDPKNLTSGTWKSGEVVSLSVHGGKREDWTITPSLYPGAETKFSGLSSIEFLIPTPNIYEVKLSSSALSYFFETEETPWHLEWKNLLPQEDRMRELAKINRGEYFSFEDRQKIFEKKLSGKQIISSVQSPWNREAKGLSWLYLVALITTLCLDFFLRKRFQWDL
ncbi:MAG: hypothetical protein COV44_05000 [Deltaproteobacteria bacterium CG11_big_fil_rev_8_21_14_0_20_45_16]|nr:MAG: hypothetical protein COV44_05000 [Deltaproteobacteria bacterium CG11_big_fil_rev_8_21_14_0_20_45_16]